MSQSLTRWRIWRAPVALAGLSLAGLLIALLADGVGDMLSWCLLAVPIAVSIWFAARHSP